MPRRRKDNGSVHCSVASQSLSSSSSNSSNRSGREKPQQRSAANARERARMRVLSRAFCRLKTTLPWVPADTKLSKLDTLRLATTYIAHLRSVLVEGSVTNNPLPTHPLSTSWPFMFSKSGGGTSSPTSSIGSESPTLSDSFHCAGPYQPQHEQQQQPQLHQPHPQQLHDMSDMTHHAMYSSIPIDMNYGDHLIELH